MFNANLDITDFQARAGDAAKLLRALGNERRLMILCQLSEGERSVGELLPAVGLSQSALSQHLAVLREEGLVATRREGTSIFYRIADPAALKVIAVLIDCWSKRPHRCDAEPTPALANLTVGCFAIQPTNCAAEPCGTCGRIASIRGDSANTPTVSKSFSGEKASLR